MLESAVYQPRWGYRPHAGRITHGAAEGDFLVLVTEAGEVAAFKVP